MKKAFIWLLLMCFAFSAFCPQYAAGEAPVSSMLYRYRFMPGTALEGEGIDTVHELMNAVHLEVTRQKEQDVNRYLINLISEGESAFTLQLEEGVSGQLSMQCSLLGNRVLVCRKEQLSSFLHTLIQVLGGHGILSDDALERFHSLADRLSAMILSYLNHSWDDLPDSGINLDPYLDIVAEFSSRAESSDLDGTDPRCPGAVTVHSYALGQDDLNRLVEAALKNLEAIPVLSEKLNSGELHIGRQIITVDWIKTLFSSIKEDAVLSLYQGADQKILKLDLTVPDLPRLIEDPALAGIQGISLQIQRHEETNGNHFSLTRISLPGYPGSLMTVRLDQIPGGKILSPVSGKEISDVGTLDEEGMWKLLYSMGLTIAARSLDMLLTLPRFVFDDLVKKII